MLKIILIALIIFLAISFFFIILIVNRKQATRTFSIQAFLGNSSYNLLDNEQIEKEKSLLEKINDYLNDKDDEIIGDDDDGE